MPIIPESRAELFPWFLFLHLAAVIVGLGPSFVFSRLAATGRREPGQGTFAARLVHAVSTGMVTPLAAVVFLSGLGIIWSARIDLLANKWLLVAMALFLLNLGYAMFVQNPTLARLIQMSADPPTEDPPPELAVLRRRVAWGGIYLRASILFILFLMVFKPF
jgi:hypothetical protein